MRAGVAALVLFFGGCSEARPITTKPPPIGRPVASPPPPGSAAPLPPPGSAAPLPEPTPASLAVERTEGRLVVTTAASAEEILLVPDGIVWTESGEVRAVFADDETPRVLATLTDPHGLATDGRSVLWLGDEANGRYDLATGNVTALPMLAGPGQQEELAFADALYARSRPDALWRIDGVGGARSISVVRLPFHPEPAWRLRPGFAAAKRTLYVPADTAAGKYALLRFATAGKITAIPLQHGVSWFDWSVAVNGDVVLVADDRGTISRIGARELEASQLFVHPGARQVCWCGAAVCTFTADGRVSRHGVGGAAVRPIADDARGATIIACERGRIAWERPRTPASSQIIVVELR